MTFFTETKGRGTCIYTKTSLNAINLTITGELADHSWCKINLKGHDNLIIGCMYRSPNSTREDFDNMTRTIQYVADLFNNGRLQL